MAEILDYIRDESGPERAHSILGQLLAAAARLPDMPLMGHERKDLTDLPVRFWTVHSWLIVYLPDTSPLQVVRVINAHRDVRRLLEIGEG